MMQGMLRRMARREPAPPQAPGAHELTPEDRRIVERAMPHTMTSMARIQAVIDAVRYCNERGITGAFAECGVWRGGSVLAMISRSKSWAPNRGTFIFTTPSRA
jgi:O-methyltransferase